MGLIALKEKLTCQNPNSWIKPKKKKKNLTWHFLKTNCHLIFKNSNGSPWEIINWRVTENHWLILIPSYHWGSQVLAGVRPPCDPLASQIRIQQAGTHPGTRQRLLRVILDGSKQTVFADFEFPASHPGLFKECQHGRWGQKHSGIGSIFNCRIFQIPQNLFTDL